MWASRRWATTDARASRRGGLLDDKGHFIDSLRTRHAGIGSVEFPPRAGRRYMAEFPDRKGRLHRFELPDAKDYTFVLRVDPTDSTFIVSIRFSLAPFLLSHRRPARKMATITPKAIRAFFTTSPL